MKPNPSQYPGTLKTTICTWCHADLSNKNWEQQLKHETNCTKQEKLFND